MKTRLSYYKKLLIQFLKFGVVGISNTLLSLIVTYAFMALLIYIFAINTIWSLNLCTFCGYLAGVCNSYIWNSTYVFKNKTETNKKRIILKVFICYGMTYFLSMVIMDVLVEILKVSPVIAPIPRLIVTIPLNFIANKFWAFKDK